MNRITVSWTATPPHPLHGLWLRDSSTFSVGDNFLWEPTRRDPVGLRTIEVVSGPCVNESPRIESDRPVYDVAWITRSRNRGEQLRKYVWQRRQFPVAWSQNVVCLAIVFGTFSYLKCSTRGEWRTQPWACVKTVVILRMHELLTSTHGTGDTSIIAFMKTLYILRWYTVPGAPGGSTHFDRLVV